MQIDKPISHQYPKPSKALLTELQNAKACILEERDRLILDNFYYQRKLPGTTDTVYSRSALAERLYRVAKALPAGTELVIFDAYRTRETQAYLFDEFYELIKAAHPGLSAEALQTETRKFVSHPTDKSHFPVPLHLSGGAVDLTIRDAKTKQHWDMGTAFDATEDASRTDYFEQDFHALPEISEARYLTIRNNRRMLFHLMRAQDFINYAYEWWHFDLGSCHWAKQLEQDWFFPEMVV